MIPIAKRMLLAILSYLSPSWYSVSFSRQKDVQTSMRQCSGVKYTAESRQFQARSSTTMWPRVSHFTSLDHREASFPVMHKCGPMTVKRPSATEHIKTPASQTSPEIGWPSPRILPHCCSALPLRVLVGMEGMTEAAAFTIGPLKQAWNEPRISIRRKETVYHICLIKLNSPFLQQENEKNITCCERRCLSPSVSWAHAHQLPCGTSSHWDVFNIYPEPTAGRASREQPRPPVQAKVPSIGPACCTEWSGIYGLFYKALQGQKCSSCIIPMMKRLWNSTD